MSSLGQRSDGRRSSAGRRSLVHELPPAAKTPAPSLYSEQQHADRDSLNEPDRAPSLAPPDACKTPSYRGKLGAGRTLLGILSTARSSASDMLEYREPFVHLWIVLSSLYGRLLVILMLAFCVTEVMDNSVKLLSLQGVFLMYLYVGSIAVIICIYMWVLVDSCASLGADGELGAPPPAVLGGHPRDPELGASGLVGGFGSLKKAHISRARTSATSFYLRIGALAFGLGTLVFNGLEMAMHSMMEGDCLNDVVFVHPVLHGLFTFLQMHFLFVNSQVLVERFGLAARFGFMHLAATNLALWVRLVVWESGNEWTYFVHLAQSALLGGARLASSIPTPLELRGFPRSVVSRQRRDLAFASNYTLRRGYQPVSQHHIAQVVALHECLNTNSLGQLWTSSMPFLYPFIVQFSLIAAAVTFVMGQNVGRSRIQQTLKKAHAKNNNNNNNIISNGSSKNGTAKSSAPAEGDWSVDCGGATKGLFLGLLCVVAGIVVIIIFLVVKEDEQFPIDTVFWLTSGMLAAILSLSTVVTAAGLVQVRKLSFSGREPSALDSLLGTATATGVQLYSAFGIVVGASGMATAQDGDSPRHAMLLAVSALQLVQACAQCTFVSEVVRRSLLTRHQAHARPARQAVTFLLCANSVLWVFDTFVTQSWMSQELQLRFFGVLAWGVVSRVGLPLLVFYRFHSCVLLLEAWKRSYRAPPLDPGN
ncbi:proton channel OtopLc-like isoform X3 [Bacillus rossius redtenbacheri]|uniref:proton channel OtopLc-like isoform X3 n=1 Tax=Bacillus rossius redtenbacheri TaxID=93214 RepID=UPI002FDE7B0D